MKDLPPTDDRSHDEDKTFKNIETEIEKIFGEPKSKSEAKKEPDKKEISGIPPTRETSKETPADRDKPHIISRQPKEEPAKIEPATTKEIYKKERPAKMEDKVIDMPAELEEKLYSEYQHISSVKTPLIISGVALLGSVVGMFWLDALIFSILGLIPIAFAIYLWVTRDVYSITDRRFVWVSGMAKKKVVEVPMREVVGVEVDNGQNQAKKFADLDVITTVKYGEKILIQKDHEYGVYRCFFVANPQIFKETIELAKSRHRGIA
jgi:hypothetical protein